MVWCWGPCRFLSKVCSLTQLFGSWPLLVHIDLSSPGKKKKNQTGQHSRNVLPLCGSLPLCVYGWCQLSLRTPPIACPLPPGECLWSTVCRRWVKHCFGKISVKLVELEALVSKLFVVTLSDRRVAQTHLHHNHLKPVVVNAFKALNL